MKTTLLKGDCLHELHYVDANSVDLIIADLPYNTTNCVWDSMIDMSELWVHYKSVRKPNAAVILFSQVPFNIVLGASNLEELRYEWIWEKTTATGHLNANRMPMKAHENILVFYDRLPPYNPQKTTGHTPVNGSTKHQEVGAINGKTQSGQPVCGSTERLTRTVLVLVQVT